MRPSQTYHYYDFGNNFASAMWFLSNSKLTCRAASSVLAQKARATLNWLQLDWSRCQKAIYSTLRSDGHAAAPSATERTDRSPHRLLVRRLNSLLACDMGRSQQCLKHPCLHRARLGFPLACYKSRRRAGFWVIRGQPNCSGRWQPPCICSGAVCQAWLSTSWLSCAFIDTIMEQFSDMHAGSTFCRWVSLA